MKSDRPSEMNIDQIARVAYEVNRAYCQALGDFSHEAWEKAPQWQRDSTAHGVLSCFDHPNMTPRTTHDSWMTEKIAAGWKHGPIKDAILKQHPCLVPYDELPAAQKVKDYIFLAVTKALS